MTFEESNLQAVSLQRRFCKHMVNVPDEWRMPAIEVIDTFETVQLGLQALGIQDIHVVVEAVKLVLERRDKLEQGIEYKD